MDKRAIYNSINTLIDKLVADNAKLESIFRQALIIANELKDEKFKKWLKHELNGYPLEIEVPEYRLIKVNVKGDLIQETGRRFKKEGVLMPIEYLSKESREMYDKYNLCDGIAKLERFVKKGGMHVNLPYNWIYDFKPFIQGYQIERIWVSVDCSNIIVVLSKSKNILLEFLLEKKEMLGVNEDELVETVVVDKLKPFWDSPPTKGYQALSILVALIGIIVAIILKTLGHI